MRAVAIVVVLALAGCSADYSSPPEGVRYVSAELGFTTSHPETWKSEPNPGRVSFAPENSKLAKHTIVVRAANIPREIREGVPANLEEIVTTTERALRGMPRSQSLQRSQVTAELRGARFTFTFVPRDAAKPYRREHVVLVGQRRMFHVMYTAPAREPFDEAAFNRIISTLEEG